MITRGTWISICAIRTRSHVICQIRVISWRLLTAPPRSEPDKWYIMTLPFDANVHICFDFIWCLTLLPELGKFPVTSGSKTHSIVLIVHLLCDVRMTHRRPFVQRQSPSQIDGKNFHSNSHEFRKWKTFEARAKAQTLEMLEMLEMHNKQSAVFRSLETPLLLLPAELRLYSVSRRWFF